jgi:DsbC/DsbD-like thiol-disulfide interchange protein
VLCCSQSPAGPEQQLAWRNPGQFGQPTEINNICFLAQSGMDAAK